MIDDSKDRVMSIRFGKTNYKIHGYLLEWKGGWVCGDLVHWWASTVGDDFVLLARCTTLNIFCNPGMHVRPPVVPLGLGDGFVASGMTGYEAFVHYSHDLPFDRKVRGNRQLSIFSPAWDFSLRWF